ncbi:hypothetical protein [Pseudomonas atagonensis]|uniref:hypothetical protein n=1 Tax=Pseudomonas atagonensis TaxID=2609964 RepID=UPI00140E275F|nr:hypothetical protein [Pseudomonas atagonensis]
MQFANWVDFKDSTNERAELLPFIGLADADQEEQSAIAEKLTRFLQQRAENSDSSIDLLVVPRVKGSTLDIAQEAGRVALLKMTRTPIFESVRRTHSLSSDAVFCVNDTLGLLALSEGLWRYLGEFVHAPEFPKEDFDMLMECATQTGGQVVSGSFIGIGQWLQFHQYAVPTEVAEIENLIACLKFKLPAAPLLGDFHELIAAPEDSPFHLSEQQRGLIRSLIEETTQGRMSLLRHLCTSAYTDLDAPSRRQEAARLLEDFWSTDKAADLGTVLHDLLDWHLETAEPQIAARQLKLLLATAVIIDLGLTADKHTRTIAGFDFYQPNHALLTAPQVRERFEAYLVESNLAEPDFASLAAYLLLAFAAPEFLIADTPEQLTLGKPGWVVVTQAVTLIEMSAPGTARSMSFSAIKNFSHLLPISEEQRVLHELTAVAPVINWAVLNGIVTYTVDKDYDQQTFTVAAEYFERYMEALHQSENGLSAIPPDRRELARQALLKVMPAGEYLEAPTWRFTSVASLKERSWTDLLQLFSISGLLINIADFASMETKNQDLAISELARLRLSILDLYMSDDLIVDGRLNNAFFIQEGDNSPADAFLRLAELPPAIPAFEQAFAEYYAALQKSLAAVLKIAICSLPEDERTFLTNSYVTLHTVRPGVNTLNPFQETQAQRDEAKGRYGIILCGEQGKEVRSYELFSLRGICRRNVQLAERFKQSGVLNDTPSLSFTGKSTDFQTKRHEQAWPIDATAYLKGDAPRPDMTSSVVVEKLWYMQMDLGSISSVSMFFTQNLSRLVALILEYHPVATRKSLYDALNTQTDLQKWRKQSEEFETFLLDVIVPFKKCIEDIRSGEDPRVAEGIGGCILDGLAIVGLLVGLGTQVASVITKTASTTAKALSIARASVRLVVALLNPLDGLATLALKGSKLAVRGVLFISDKGVSAISTATRQLRRLTGGAQSYDLIKAARRFDLVAGEAGELANVIALQRNSDLYALNQRVGGAWGPRLKTFSWAKLSPFKLFFPAKPHSYTRAYVKKAISLAKSKLDNAIALLADTQDENIKSVLKHVFGSDSEAVFKHLASNLRDMRRDLDSVTLANMSFRRGDPGALAALRPAAYKRWRAGIDTGAELKGNAKKFMDIFPEELDQHYRVSNYDDYRISDTLIHEMAHGAPDTLDLYYGETLRGAVPADYDVVGLVELARDAHKADPRNLSNPHFRMAHPPGFVELETTLASKPSIIRKHPALYNAESISLAVALLDQLETNRFTFGFNISAIGTAVKNTDVGQFVFGPVLINLAKL